MKRILTILVVNLVIIGIIVGTSAFIEKYSEEEREATTDYYLTETTIVMEEGQNRERIISEIREAIAVMPPEIIRNFNEEGYKIIVTPNDNSNHTIDFEDRSITVRDEKDMITPSRNTRNKSSFRVMFYLP